MITHVEVQTSIGGPWRRAELTDERGYKHPVIVLDGEHEVRGVAEVVFIRPRVGTDCMMLDAARAAGYTILEEHRR
jgi:hypothetical protein